MLGEIDEIRDIKWKFHEFAEMGASNMISSDVVGKGDSRAVAECCVAVLEEGRETTA